jgi:riboflavin synthase
MFTGIIENIALVKNIKKIGVGGELEIETEGKIADLEIGESISINGVCLTVTKFKENSIFFDFMKETALKSNIGRLKANDKVNLERSLQLNGRISGHLVSGHVDCLAKLVKVIKLENSKQFFFQTNNQFIKDLVPKGSIGINGISLTVIEVDKTKKIFSVGIIPHTLKNTNLQFLKISDQVNLEIDIFFKYIKNYLETLNNSAINQLSK